jgi:opacity protein-like surface antigen
MGGEKMHNKKILCLLSAACVFTAGSAMANVWVFEPSISLDQRFDDNYFLEPSGNGKLSATRAVGELGLSRESAVAVIKGLVRVDGLLTTQSDAGEEGLESNQLMAFDVKMRSARSRYGVLGSFKQDTPSRDIAADLSDPGGISSDTGLNIPSQSSNVARQEITLKPYFSYDLTRRLEFSSKATLTFVEHELPSVQDAIYQRYYSTLSRDESGNIDVPVLAYSEVTIDDVGVFSPNGELDDFNEGEIEIGLRYKFNPISTVTFTAAFSKFNAQVLVDPSADIPNAERTPDPNERQILRFPRRDSLATTTSFRFGYERFLTPTLQFGVSAGIYANTSDTTDTLRVEDWPENQDLTERSQTLKSDNDGWLASVGITRDAGLTRYVGKFSVDVQPSSSGAQVETQELTGDIFRVINPRLNFSLRARAYEPDRLGANEDDEFARRFISFEPKIEWKYARNWTVSAAYRYRRQKARIDPVPAESNAILLSLKYTPPSKIRDAARANGL